MHCDILTAFLPSLNSGKLGRDGGGADRCFWQLYQHNPHSRICLVELARISFFQFFFTLQKRLRMSLPCFSSVASYVSAMVPVKSPREYYVQQEVIVLFCETVER